MIGYDAEHGTKWNGVDRNDYCFVMVPTSNATPTEIKQVDRYKVTETPNPVFPTGPKVKAWEYEYTLNNSGFTAAQWATINSGLVEGSATLNPVYGGDGNGKYTYWSYGTLTANQPNWTWTYESPIYSNGKWTTNITNGPDFAELIA